VIGETLVLIGMFVIFAGFLLIIISTFFGGLQEPGSGQDYSKEKGQYWEKNGFENNPSSRTSYGDSPEDKGKPRVRGGGVIMIGPIPIIFGSDKDSAKTLVILAIILMLISLLFFRGFF
jgi:uncharacterized protein (TIGR00304 family)